MTRRHRSVVLVLVAMLSAMPAVAPAQETWGSSVNGVQMHLALAKDAPLPLPGDLPSLEMQIRNLGADPITLHYDSLYGLCEIEIDGVWYSQVAAFTRDPRRPELAPGQLTRIISLTFDVARLHALEPDGRLAKVSRKFSLRSGTHVLRVRTPGENLQTATGQPVTLVSNRITTDIPALSEDGERRVLVGRASEGGFGAIPAIQKLAERFPAAALEAIEAATKATPDAGVRSQFVELAGTLPGDVPVAFLRRQLEQDPGLLPKVRSAETLHERGATGWVPVLIGMWQRIQTRTELDHDEWNAGGQLISLLARSGDVQAIEALTLGAAAPVDMRMAVARAFLPRALDPNTYRTGSTGPLSLAGYSFRAVERLPDGPAGEALERLLTAALDDEGQRLGLRGAFDDVSYTDPRVCDIAALVLALRFPSRYSFRWSPIIAERDAQIQQIRVARQLRDRVAIDFVKNAIVAEIDSNLPRTTFDEWLRGIVGAQADVAWETNDCGEQTGNPALDRGRDFPMCVEARVRLEGGRDLYLLLAVGTRQQGLTTKVPSFFYGVVMRAGAPEVWLKNLGQTAAAIAGINPPAAAAPRNDAFAPATDVSFTLSLERTSYGVGAETPVRYRIVNVSSRPLYVPRGRHETGCLGVGMPGVWGWFEDSTGQLPGQGIGYSCAYGTAPTVTDQVRGSSVLLAAGGQVEGVIRLNAIKPEGLPVGPYRIRAVLPGWTTDVLPRPDVILNELGTSGARFLSGETWASVDVTITP